jgi:hypothetical protein
VGENVIWAVQGGGVDPISRPLGAGYRIAGSAFAGYALDEARILDATLEKIYRVNLVSGSWSTEELDDGENEPHVMFSLAGKYYFGVENSTTQVGAVLSPTNPRAYDTVTGETHYAAKTPQMFMLGPSYKYTPRHLFLQLRRQDDSPADLAVTVHSRSGSDARTILGSAIDDDVTRHRLDLGTYRGEPWLQLEFGMTTDVDDDGIDIERMVLGVDVERVR